MEVTKKFIIENGSDLCDFIAMERIAEVIDMGLIGDYDTKYCYATRFTDCVVTMDKTKYGYKVYVRKD